MKQTEKMTELVRCFQAGDTEALGEIYIESKDFLMSFGRKRIRGYEDDAEDIVQDAFQKALENLKDLHKAESALSWMSTTVSNAGTDKTRKEKKYFYPAPAVDKDGNEYDWTDDIQDTSAENDVEEMVIQRETKSEVDKALGKLDPKLASLLMMHDGKKMPLSEISRITGMKEGTIKSTLFRARKKFREIWPVNDVRSDADVRPDADARPDAKIRLDAEIRPDDAA